ncbi:hypothetical protein PSQ19_02135 [Devosia algicola]|uniref:Uncharacterized protein n=1 Tax=Devosia algicola TaxID=3026418 RepID=A0ABY7YNY5_9HYPH|nr:hypothetical protein [Devosia algicola]WDR03029.1 hypothetical protein PSQ19_02135 [Devosia algicola]
MSNHPAIKALTAQIAELDKQIGIEGRRVADALEAEAQIEAGIETSLQADLTKAQGIGINRDPRNRDAGRTSA